MSKLKTTITLAMLLFISGCASYYGAAKIVSYPPGAEVIDMSDGTILGVTPVVSWWRYDNKNNQHLALRFKKDGFHDKVTSFWLSLRHKNLQNATDNPQLVEVSLQKRAD